MPGPSSRGQQTIGRNLYAKLEGHKGPVNVARYSKGSANYILTGGQDRTVRLWNASQGNEITKFASHGYEVLSVTIAHDNAMFASSGGDRSVFVWDVATGVTTRRYPGHMGKIHTVEFNDNASVLASGSFDCTVRLWDLKSQSRQPIQTLEEARDAVQTIVVHPTSIVTGSVDGLIRTYDIRKGELRADFIGQPVTSIVPTKDTQTLLITTLDSHIRLLDTSTGKVLNTFTGHVNTSYRCRACFGQNEATVVCGDEDGKVWAWDLLDAKVHDPNPPPKVHDKVITWTEHHPSERSELVTSGADGVCKIWRNPE